MTSRASHLPMLLLAALTLCSGVAPLIVHYLPMNDYPQDLLIARILCRYDDPGTDYCLNFTRDLGLRPYIGYYGIAWLLRSRLDEEASFRLAIVLFLLLTPPAVAWYTYEVDPGRTAAALLVIPTLFSGNYYYLGLVNFMLSLPPFFAGCACLLRMTSRSSLRKTKILSLILFLFFAGLTFLCHAISFAMLCLMAFLYGIVGRRKTRGSLMALALATGLVAWLLTPRSALHLGNVTLSYVAAGAPIPDLYHRGIVFYSPIASAIYLLSQIANDRSTLLDGALWGIPAGIVILSAIRGRPRLSSSARKERFLLPAASLALLFLSPGAMGLIETVNMRFTAFLFLCLPALFPKGWLEKRDRAALSLFAAACLLLALISHLRFDREARDFDPILAASSPQTSTLPLSFDAQSAFYLSTKPYLYFGHLIQYTKGGIGMEIFGGPHMPVRMRERMVTGMILHRWRPWLITSRVMALYPRQILTRGLHRTDLIPPEYRLVVASGPFRLYRRAE